MLQLVVIAWVVPASPCTARQRSIHICSPKIESFLQIERARRVVEQAVKEHQEQNNELNSQNCGLAAAKSQLDNEIALLKVGSDST